MGSPVWHQDQERTAPQVSIFQNEDFRRGFTVGLGVLAAVYAVGLAAGLFRRII